MVKVLLIARGGVENAEKIVTSIHRITRIKTTSKNPILIILRIDVNDKSTFSLRFPDQNNPIHIHFLHRRILCWRKPDVHAAA